MPDRFAPEHFHEVASFLLEESGDESSSPDRWRAVEDARTRSSISRSYYAVFLRLKGLLVSVAPRGWQFPRVDTHSTLLGGLEGVLGAQHLLVMRAKRLWLYRKRSDYDLGDGYLPSVGLDATEWCEDAAEVADLLTNDELERIVAEIGRVQERNRQERLKRRRRW